MNSIMKHGKNIDIFCSASKNEIEKIEAWLIPSLLNQRHIDNICLYIINYTGIGNIYSGKSQIQNVSIKEINKNKSCGFGEAHNFAFSLIKPFNYFFIINPDVYLHENCLIGLIKKIETSAEIGIVEARQLPFEHPKEYDEKSGETPWASGFGILVRSEFFKKIGGFDENFWMYCEDVDLSWRAWIAGYKVIYEVNAVGYHFTGAHFSYKDERYYLENFWSARNFLYISYKYWGKNGFKKALRIFNESDYSANFKFAVVAALSEDEKRKCQLFSENNKNKISEFKEKIKITGFNSYHNFR